VHGIFKSPAEATQTVAAGGFSRPPSQESHE